MDLAFEVDTQAAAVRLRLIGSLVDTAPYMALLGVLLSAFGPRVSFVPVPSSYPDMREFSCTPLARGLDPSALRQELVRFFSGRRLPQKVM